jgi:hypothetical protein
MAGSDARSKRVTGTGALTVGRSRLRLIVVTTNSSGAGRLTLSDGDGGSTLLDVDLVVSTTHNVYIPEEGILFQSDIFVATATNLVSATFFWS